MADSPKTLSRAAAPGASGRGDDVECAQRGRRRTLRAGEFLHLESANRMSGMGGNTHVVPEGSIGTERPSPRARSDWKKDAKGMRPLLSKGDVLDRFAEDVACEGVEENRKPSLPS
jgi:hypothetical protein